MKFKKKKCEHGHTGSHVIKDLSGGKFYGCYGGTPDIDIDSPDGPGAQHTWLRNGARPTEESGAMVGKALSGSHRRIALDYIIAMGGATSDSISIYLEEWGAYVPPNQVASRIKELQKGGWVQESGYRRSTRRGGEAIVWRYYKDLGTPFEYQEEDETAYTTT